MSSYFMPVNYYFGKNSLKKNEEKIAKFGKKAFIVTGKSSAKKSGVLDELLPILENLKIEYTIFDEIKENPSLKTIKKGADIYKDGDYDFFIGIGGGSPIDAAKAISAITANNFEGKEIFQGKIKTAFPIISIPTTSGTGTEVTPYSVVTDHETGTKAGFGHPSIFPKISFLDPKFTTSLPKRITKNTAIDALSHLLEGIFSNKRNNTTYPLIFEGIKLIYENLEKSLENPQNIEFRENLMKASLYGGIVIAQSSTTLQHSLGYPLTTEYGTPHGLANGIVMIDVLNLFYPNIKEEIDNLFSYIGISKSEFSNWLEKIGMIADFKIESEELIEKFTGKVMATRNMLLNPIKVSENQVKEIYRKFM